MKIEKTWKPSPKLGTLGVFGDVFNVNNKGVALTITNRSGSSFGVRPNLWMEPRTVRAGVRWVF